MASNRFLKIWHNPVVSQVIGSRLETGLIVAFGAVQAGLAYAHLPGWPCPIKAATGIPCPGCGLSSACAELLHGQFGLSFQTHAFAPFFLFALAFLAVALVLPENRRAAVAAWVGRVEKNTGVTAWFLMCFILYWGLRLARVL